MTALTGGVMELKPFFQEMEAADLFSEAVLQLIPSRILQISREIRRRKAAGEEILAFTVGDFDPRSFPFPEALSYEIRRAFEEGECNYTPSIGLPVLREALAREYSLELSLDYPAEAFIQGAGARPLIYGAWRALISPGELALAPSPNWNVRTFAQLTGARLEAPPCRPEAGFLPTLEDLQPWLSEARILSLCSPMNPAGTQFKAEVLKEICAAILEENRQRETQGRRPLFLIYDQVYRLLNFRRPHTSPPQLHPEMARYTILVDALSKGFAGPGVRLGWLAAPPPLIDRLAQLMGCVGAWSPRPVQLGFARYLRAGKPGFLPWLENIQREIQERLKLLSETIQAWEAEGLPVRCIEPEGGIYLSLYFDLQARFPQEEGLRRWLLDLGLGVVPFSAFGHQAAPGWVRLSVGAIDKLEIQRALKILKAALQSF